MDSITFTSSSFPVVAHEDEGLNPGILGKSLSEWIEAALEGTRFEITETVEEDFGYCLMVHRKPYWLWVGCSGDSDHDYPEEGLTAEVAQGFPLESIEWQVWVAAEWGIFSRLTGRDNRKQDAKDLLAILKEKLSNDCDVRFL